MIMRITSWWTELATRDWIEGLIIGLMLGFMMAVFVGIYVH